MDWFANYHYIFVHFPIALIIMAGIAELIMKLQKKPNLDATVKFLLISAALFTVPTVISGLSLEDAGVVSEAKARNFCLYNSCPLLCHSFSPLFESAATSLYCQPAGAYPLRGHHSPLRRDYGIWPYGLPSQVIE